MAVVSGDEADGGIKVDEVHFSIGHKGNLGEALGKADLDAVFQEGASEGRAQDNYSSSTGPGIKVFLSEILIP